MDMSKYFVNGEDDMEIDTQPTDCRLLGYHHVDVPQACRLYTDKDDNEPVKHKCLCIDGYRMVVPLADVPKEDLYECIKSIAFKVCVDLHEAEIECGYCAYGGNDEEDYCGSCNCSRERAAVEAKIALYLHCHDDPMFY